jgi:hypothetical protein
MNSDGVGDPLVVANVASGQSHGVSQSIEAKMKRAANKTDANPWHGLVPVPMNKAWA